MFVTVITFSFGIFGWRFELKAFTQFDVDISKTLNWLSFILLALVRAAYVRGWCVCVCVCVCV